MNISYSWLKDYVDIDDITPAQLDDLLTFSGLEVEGVEKKETIKGGLEHVVIGQVLTCEPHPDSDHLHVTTVNIGTDTPLNIVCGAPNVAAGQKVVCAFVGTKIYTSDTEYHEIKKGKLRGVMSEGMLCAADELQLGNDHDGIMVLPDDAVPGTPAKDYFNIKDEYILEVAITANRSDATSHIGVARDIVAVRNTREGKHLEIRRPTIADHLTPQTEGTSISVEVADSTLCPRYTGITMRNVEVKDSPEWLQSRLRSVGLRPINNIVDITNYVLMEVGQPLHAFDADMIEGGKITVKQLPQDTPFTTLDGVEHRLDQRDLMICNEKEGMCIAGVFGGLKSGVTTNTKNIFIESAYFNPVSIRKTSKRHNIKTDASFRYERGCDPNITEWALRRAVYLIQQIAGGKVCGEMIDIYPTPIEKAKVEINYQRIFNLIGKNIPTEIVKTALTSLEIEIEHESTDGLTVRIPTCKVDVTRECDVVEEIMRIYGYNNIDFDEWLNSCLSYSKKPNPLRLKNMVSDYLSASGFSEIMNNSLTKSEYYEDNPDFKAEACVQIINPLSKELNVMRQTLLYGGLECIARNINYKIFNQRTYEFGHTYIRTNANGEDLPVTKKFAETHHISLFVTGDVSPETWHSKAQSADIFYMKMFVYNILKKMRVNESRLVLEPSNSALYSEGANIVLRDSKKVVATFGCISRNLLKRMDIKQEVFYADLDWDLLLKNYPNKEVTYAEIPKFPSVKRDLAMVVDKSTTFAEIEQVARQAEKRLLQQVTLFDIYEGKGIAEGKKSYAVTFILQDTEKTLTDKQIDSVMAKIQKQLESQLQAKIRG